MKKLLTLTIISVLTIGNLWAQKKDELIETINLLKIKEATLSSKIDSLSMVCVANQQIIEQMNGIIAMYQAQAESTGKLLTKAEEIITRLEKSATTDNIEIKGELSSGLALARQGALFGYVDKDCKWVVEPIFEEAERFVDGYAFVRRDDKWGVIDKEGNECIACQYSRVEVYYGNIFKVYKENLIGLQRSDGTIIQPIKYFDIGTVYHNRSRVCIDGLFGYLNEKGEIAISIKYKDANSFGDDLIAMIKDQSGWHDIDIYGNIVD